MIKHPELSGVCAELSKDGSIILPGVKLYLTPQTDKDLPFIISTWVRSYRRVNGTLTVSKKHIEGLVKPSDAGYLRDYPRIVERLAPTAWVLRAEDSQACHGYIVGLGPQESVPAVLHYVYLPPELRGVGLCKAMVSGVCGEGTIECSSFWPKRWPANFRYNPYRIVP